LHPERLVCMIMSDTKEFIIDQAYKLFLNKSYEAVSISDISKSIGFSKGALYHHFLNKEELYKAVVDKYLKIIGLSYVKEGQTLAEFVEDNIAHVKEIVYTICIDDQPFIPVNYLSFLIDALRHYPGFEKENEEFFNQEIEKLKIVVDQAVKNGEIREDIDTSVVALHFFSISVGIAANLFRQNSPAEAIESFKSQMIEFYKILKK
jgi:TetR/AcrR family transcriptional regulator, transcriptional repressor for nem operon